MSLPPALPRLLVTLPLALLAPCINADDLLNLSLDELAKVRVSSTSYFDESLARAASSVTYTDQSSWQALGVRNLGDLINAMPSTVAPIGYGGTRSMAIRGYYSYGGDRGIAVRLDDIPMNLLDTGKGTAALDSYDLATLRSTELIRGPGSAMHGANAFHGVLSLYTLDPEQDGVRFRADGGNEQYRAASVESSVTNEDQHYSMVLAHRRLGDQALRYPYTDPNTAQRGHGERAADTETNDLVLKARSTPNADTSYDATVYVMNVNADQLLGIGYEDPRGFLADRDWSKYSESQQILKLGAQHDWSEQHSLQAFTYYWQNKDHFFADFSFTDAGTLEASSHEEKHYGVHVVDLRHYSGGSTLAYGYEYQFAEQSAWERSVTDTAGNVTFTPADDHLRDEALNSALLDGRYVITRDSATRTDLAYGVRLDDYEQYDLQTSPRLGIIQNLSDDAIIKLLYGRAYRKPTSFELLPSPSIAANADLQPERLDNIELTYQQNFTTWLTTITLFKNRWSDAIELRAHDALSGNSDFQFRNVGEKQAQGIEAEAHAAWNRWNLDISASHVASENADTGEDYRAFPDWMLRVGAGYAIRHDLDLSAATHYHHRRAASESTTTAGGGDLDSAQYLRTDLTLIWSITRDFTSSFAIRNLFDRKNFYPSYFSHEEGIPDSNRNVSIAFDWYIP